MFNWEYLKHLIDIVPYDLDKSKKKKIIPKETKIRIRKRDNNKCKICGKEDKLGNDGVSILHTHHIIPNKDNDDDNLVTLCKYCHQTVHDILFVIGKGSCVNVLRKFKWNKNVW